MEYNYAMQLDISGKGKLEKVIAKQWDTESRLLEITLTKDGKPIRLPETVIVRLRATKPDHTCVFNDCQIENGIVRIPLTEQLLASCGIVRADLGIYEGSSLLSTTQFLIQVVHTPIDYEAVESSYEFQTLHQALRTIASSAETAEKAAATVKTLVDDCESATTAANQMAVQANTAAEAAQTAAQRAETAADACDVFVEQEIGDVVEAAIGDKVDAKVEESIVGIVGKPNGVAGLDQNGKITPMPTVSDIGAARSEHTHIAADLTDTVPIEQGGTGAVTAAAALMNLGAAASVHHHAASSISSGVLPIARGGTGASTASLARYALGLGNTTGPVPIANGGTGASTAANALETLGAQPKIEDTGWTALPLLNGVTAANCGGRSTPCYRKIGNHVFIEGGVTITPSGETFAFATLPEGYRPSSVIHVLQSVSGKRIARINVDTAGNMKLEWVVNLSDGSNSTAKTWMSVKMDYFVDA